MEIASSKNHYHYNPALKYQSRQLRRYMTKAEAVMWKYMLSRRQMKGYAFNRQRPVLNYIGDFMCKPLLLIIEVDGISHDLPEIQKKDEMRDKKLEEAGFTVLRFSDWDILNQIEEVEKRIKDWIDSQK